MFRIATQIIINKKYIFIATHAWAEKNETKAEHKTR